MNTLARLSAACGISLVAGVLCFQIIAVEAESPEVLPELFRDAANDGADRPTGRLFLRVKAKQEDDATGPVPPVENGTPPVEPSDDADDGPEAPSFFDETIGGKAIFIIDVSNSMVMKDDGTYDKSPYGEDEDGNATGSPTKLTVAKAELIKLLRNVEDSFEFDIIWLAGGTGGRNGALPNTDAWKGKLVKCTDAVRDEAIAAVKGQTTWFGTPTWRALKRACEDYPDDLDTFVCLTDGAPFPGFHEDRKEWAGGLGQAGKVGPLGRFHQDAVGEDFPKWFAGKKANGCDLIGIFIGTAKRPRDFVQTWCATNGGKFIQR